MSDLVLGILPILVMWMLPLAPMVYAAIAATLEAASDPARREDREPATATATEIAT